MKFIKIVIVIFVVFMLGFMWIANSSVMKYSDIFLYNDLNKIPHNHVGLILGTSKYVRSGAHNDYFDNRVDAVVELYNAGKIDFIVISGDNGSVYYNEPVDMKKDIVKLGVPEEKIFLDYAGFRTYDSVIRMFKIFGQTKFTVISQEFHHRRAVFIARNMGLQAVGYNADDVIAYKGFKVKLREQLAITLAVYDVLFKVKPKFLGDPVTIQ